MKITLDLNQLLEEGKITQDEYDHLLSLAAGSTGSLAFNILIGFGVIAVSLATLALVPTPTTAIVIGLLVLVGGLALGRTAPNQWAVLANTCILVGALMAGGGITIEAGGSLVSILVVTGLFAVASVLAQSALLASLATLMLSGAIGARTGYFHASYFLVIQEPLITVLVFSVLSIGLFQLSKLLSAGHEKIAIASSRTGVFLVNFGLWVGSLWGDQGTGISATVFALVWAVALIAFAIWAWQKNRRWPLNVAAVFGGIHFYTQWFENLGASPGTVLVAGLLALGFAIGLKAINTKMKATA